ncbi:MAG TPA: hypothetical protein VGK27_10795 [Candidatus Deferrimicrobiaceae bacterium]|jgi:hypothetical protein
MKRSFQSPLACALLSVALLLGGVRTVSALEDQKIVGVVVRFDIASDGKSVEATVKDLRKDKEIKLHVTNELVIDKFRYGKLAAGAEIRAKYEFRDGKNYCSYFRKVSGE